MFGSNQWLAILLSLLPMGLCFALCLLGKVDGATFVNYCTIAGPASVALALGGSAVTKIFAKPGEPPTPPATP